MSNSQMKPNLDIEKLRADKLKSIDFDLKSVELEERKRRREETKKAIIAKINANNALENEKKKEAENIKVTKPKYTSSAKEKKVKQILKEGDKARKDQSAIRILPTTPNKSNKIKDNSERLSYTMQMDIFTKDKIKKLRENRKNLNVQDKFIALENTVKKLYYGLIIILTILIIINILIINIYL